MSGQLIVSEELTVSNKSVFAVLLLKFPDNKLQPLEILPKNNNNTTNDEYYIQQLRNQTLDFGRDISKSKNYEDSFVKNIFTQNNSNNNNNQQQLKKITESKKNQQFVLLSFDKILRSKYYGDNTIEKSVLEDVAIRLKGKKVFGEGELVVVGLDNLMSFGKKNGNKKLQTMNGSQIFDSAVVDESFLEVLREFVGQGFLKSTCGSDVIDAPHAAGVVCQLQDNNSTKSSSSTLNVGAASFEVGQPSSANTAVQPTQQQQQRPNRSIIPKHNFDVDAVAADDKIAPVFQELLNLQTDLYNQDFYSLDLRLKAVMHALVVACQNRDSFEYMNDMVNVFMNEYAEQQWESEG